MCGIVGAYWKDRPRAAERLLGDALECLRLRGPNDRGSVIESIGNGALALGHTRLSIIDLTSAGRQPMRSADGRFSIIFNGEIYNYRELRAELEAGGERFVSSSDTEVLLRAWMIWGEACLPRLDGMFAFAVHDRQNNRLTCCRDAFGIKPFFYVIKPDAFLFGSTHAAMVALRGTPPQVNWQRCYDYLVHGDYDSNDETFVAEVRHLLPAQLIEFDIESCAIIRVAKWWQPSLARQSEVSFESAAEAVRESFLGSIRHQLRSDVPIGAALSGGIDSSAVVCAMRLVEPDADINTFSYIASGTPLNEEKWVDLVNAHVGARVHKVETNEQDLLRDLDDMLIAQGEPFGSTSIYAQYCVFRLARERGVTVTLDGQGADELLAGYTGYPGSRLLSLIETSGLTAAHRFARGWSDWPSRSYPMAMLELGRVVLPNGIYAEARKLFGRDFQPDWLDVGAFQARGIQFEEERLVRSADNRGRRVVEHLAHSLQERGLPALLRHADRSSMRFSVESRVPFLTNEMADLLLGLPEEYLISPTGETKSVFRAAMRGIVPDAILDRRDKVGFATPEQQWLTALAPQLREILHRDVAEVPFLKGKHLIAAFDSIIEGRKPFSWQLWRWFNFARWYTMTGVQP